MAGRLDRLRTAAVEAWRHQQRLGDTVSTEAIASYIAAGKALVDARSWCRDHEWLPWLASTGIPSDVAARMMLTARLHRPGATDQETLARVAWLGEATKNMAGWSPRRVAKRLLRRPDVDAERLRDLEAWTQTSRDFKGVAPNA